MRTEEIKIYQFSELSEDAKEKAIEQFRDINVDSDWWDFIYSDFAALCKTIGVDIDTKRTYFSGFSHQGSGSSFTTNYVNVLDLINGINSEAWKQYAPNEKLDFCKFEIDRRVMSAIENGGIDMGIEVRPSNSESSIRVSVSYRIINANTDTPLILTILETLETDIEQNMETLNSWLYRTLEKEYEYLTSDEAIKETIEANGYEFLESGEHYY